MAQQQLIPFYSHSNHLPFVNFILFSWEQVAEPTIELIKSVENGTVWVSVICIDNDNIWQIRLDFKLL